MELTEAYQKIRQFGQAIFRLNDISVVLGVSNHYGNKILRRLADNHLLVHLKRNLWGLPEQLEPFMLPDFLTAPLPSYISLQTALSHHGMIGQIPVTIYCMTLARTQIITTPLGEYSFHHIQPDLFNGFVIYPERNIRMATVEKALFDILYLRSSKSLLFKNLPELELPADFNHQQFNHYIDQVSATSRRQAIRNAVALLRK